MGLRFRFIGDGDTHCHVVLPEATPAMNWLSRPRHGIIKPSQPERIDEIEDDILEGKDDSYIIERLRAAEAVIAALNTNHWRPFSLRTLDVLLPFETVERVFDALAAWEVSKKASK